MIGTYEEAAAALNNELPMLTSNGSSRNIYYSGDVVYKIDNSVSEGTNEAEWATYNKLIAEPIDEPFSIATTWLWWVDKVAVIAMERIYGEALNACICEEFGDEHGDSCLPEELRVPAAKYIDDTGGQNIVFNGERYFIIDMGE